MGTTAVTPPPVITCAGCNTERAVKLTPKNQPRTPAGWKHHQDEYFCSTCWHKRYLLRAITIPVAAPLEGTWEELRAQLKLLWRQTTAAANRIMTECYARDVRRKDSDEKMPPMPRVYLYPELRTEFPHLPPTTVAALEQTCQRKYRAVRYEVIWTSRSALPNYRYPTPLPIPGAVWHARMEEDHPIVSLPVGTGRIELRLKNNPQLHRQYQQFRQIARGEAVRAEAAVYQRGKNLMVKLVAWLPRPAVPQEAQGVLRVRITPQNLLTAINVKDEALWHYNGRQLRRWAIQHKRWLKEWGDDAKYENRPVPSFAARRRAAVRKFRDRMDSAMHEITMQLVGYASRRRFAAIEYDDNERGEWDLPWFKLRALLAQKCDQAGIELTVHGPPEEELTPEEKLTEPENPS